MKSKILSSIRAWHIGLVAGAAPAVALVSGYAFCGEGPVQLALALVAPAAAGAACAYIWHKRLYAWFTGLAGGLLIGLLSSLQLLMGEIFVQECFVVLATFLFFAVLGCLLGAVAEFIRLLHHIVHGLAAQRAAATADIKEKKTAL